MWRATSESLSLRLQPPSLSAAGVASAWSSSLDTMASLTAAARVATRPSFVAAKAQRAQRSGRRSLRVCAKVG